MSQPGVAAPADAAALADFVAKWRARWPEWTFAEVFLAASQRETAAAWAALQQELADAAWGGSDPTPGEAKLAWWQEELAAWGDGARRHPLGIVLRPQPAPWKALASALPALAASRARPADAAEALESVMPFAGAVARVDAALSTDASEVEGAGAEGRDSRIAALTLLQWRFSQPGDDHVPLQSLLADGGDGGSRRAWATELARIWPADTASTRLRRLLAGLARARLAHPDQSRRLSSVRALLVVWRAARG